MRDFIVIFIAVVIAKPDLPPVQPPGTYPLEEMNTEVSTIPMNPYQLAMIDTSGNFDNYQFYYEKDALPPSSK
uniref:Secreted protein n=1 Tax=Angiostrongylus cantonensis TaxID=6313 RepID=A0A0K0CW34_ANGCA